MPGRASPRLTARVSSFSGAHQRLTNAQLSWQRRTTLLLELDDGATRGWGEASPLPGYSKEGLGEARSELETLAAEPFWCEAPDLPGPGDDFATPSAWLSTQLPPLRTASARHALETALLDYWARRLAIPAWKLLTCEPVAARLAASCVVDPLAPAAFDHVERALGDGILTVKLKLGRDVGREVAFLERLRSRWGSQALALRLDVNQAWSARDAAVLLATLAQYEPEHVEEPCAEAFDWSASSVPLARDESLVGRLPDPQLLHGAAALVLKPMLLGGVARCLDWARLAREAGVRVVVSHLFDGAIALGAATHLAFAIQSPDRAAGLSRHAGLASGRPHLAPPRFVRIAHIETPKAAGVAEPPVRRLSVSAAAREVPAQVALVLPSEELTFEALAARVQPVMAWLEASGTAARVRAADGAVAFVARPGLGQLLLLYACLELGLPVLPLHPRHSDASRQELLARFTPAFFVDDEATFESLESAEPVSNLDVPAQEPDPEHDLAWLCTSGSTGLPRVARLSRRAVLAAADASELHLGWQAEDRWLLSLPFAHVGGLSVITRCLVGRRTVVVDDRSAGRAWLAQLERQRVTLLSLVPTQLARLLDDPAAELPPRLRAVLVGGARAPVAQLAEARRRSMPVLRTYGLTEACAQIATEVPGAPLGRGEGFVGRPLQGVEVRVDADGVVALRGEQLTSGYVGGAARSRDEWFVTGDRGRLEAEGLYVLGRCDHVIISGGENVSPESVEALLSEHPGVAAACVLGRPDPVWGERVEALVTLRDGACLTEVRAFAEARLADYERPRRWHLVTALPLLPTGKLDRLEAARRIAAAAES